jgi:hypothetical protein
VASRARNRTRAATQDRARLLAARFPEAREALEFCGTVFAFDGGWNELRALVQERGPERLREAAASLTEPLLREAEARYLSSEDADSPAKFFALVLLRGNPPRVERAPPERCPACGRPPQCGCLRPEAHGSAFSLVCSLCETEWRFPRAHCPACGGEKAVLYSTERFPHVQTQVCESCLRYLHVIDLGQEPAAIPLLDEVAALAIDMWARENGYCKIHLNLAGI